MQAPPSGEMGKGRFRRKRPIRRFFGYFSETFRKFFGGFSGALCRGLPRPPKAWRARRNGRGPTPAEACRGRRPRRPAGSNDEGCCKMRWGSVRLADFILQGPARCCEALIPAAPASWSCCKMRRWTRPVGRRRLTGKREYVMIVHNKSLFKIRRSAGLGQIFYPMGM